MATGTLAMTNIAPFLFKNRFRGFLPVVVDLETGGFNASTDGILEIAATFFDLSNDGYLSISHTIARNVEGPQGSPGIPNKGNNRDSKKG